MLTEQVYDAIGFGPYVIGFAYLESETLKVQHIGDTVQDISFTFEGTPSEEFPSGTAIRPDAFYSTGQIRIFKDVSMTDLVVDWTESSPVTYTNLKHMSRNLMEMAQLAYDRATVAIRDATLALSSIQGLEAELDASLQEMQQTLAAAQAAMAAQVALAEYWAQIALDAGSIANPEQAAAEARDAAIAARNAAQAAQALAESARDMAELARADADAAKIDAQNSATIAENAAALAMAWADKDRGSPVVSGRFSAKHWAETAQQIVNDGSLRWSGSLKFVSTLPPDNSQGSNGDIWIQREV